MTALAEHQFEILPDAEALDGFVFGIGAEVSLNEDGFDPGENSWITQDAENTRRGVVGFGRDVTAPKTWTWASHVNREDVDTAVDTLDRFSAAWRPEELARDPGAVTAVRYRLAGRERRIFGRPRRFAAPPTNQILSGYVPVDHDFQLVDSYSYDDTESSIVIGYASAAGTGGFVLPSTMPLSTQSGDGNGEGQVSIGGRARAYPVIRFNGAWTDPTLITDHWTLRWKGQIPVNGWVEIDARPWMLTAKNHFGGSAIGGLPRNTWLEDLWFAPQTSPGISLGGVATGGGASVEIRWRNAWTSI